MIAMNIPILFVLCGTSGSIIYYYFNLYRSSSGSSMDDDYRNDDVEMDGNQQTKIRHEGNI